MSNAPNSRDLLPPDAVAALRWATVDSGVIRGSALHAEVAQRMAARLPLFRDPPQVWLDWFPALGGGLAQPLTQSLWPKAQCWIHEPSDSRRAKVLGRDQLPWFKRWFTPTPPVWRPGQAAPVDLLWSNLGLHAQHHPAEWLTAWREALRVNGALVFSVLGPDSFLELRDLYDQLAWPAPCQDWMDMHDWGDSLLKQGWVDPVMDMERLVFTYASANDLIRDLRLWGRNLHPHRYPALRGRGWHRALLEALEQRRLARPDQRLRLTLEVIYGHALRGADRQSLPATQSIPLDEVVKSIRNRSGGDVS
jgi:malonyl-CoA O-methyltransferase